MCGKLKVTKVTCGEECHCLSIIPSHCVGYSQVKYLAEGNKILTVIKVIVNTMVLNLECSKLILYQGCMQERERATPHNYAWAG